jgi:alpha-1,2-glucosyltransferase
VHIISLLPPLWFFGFLYYTDVPSTVFVMACLLAAKKRKHLAGSLVSTISFTTTVTSSRDSALQLGCASLTLRQTNIVWVLFAMGTSLLTELSTLGLYSSALKTSSAQRQINSIRRLSMIDVIARMLRLLAFYSPVAILSIAFVLWNGRIVLGDQDNHQATLHWAQPLYCVAMMTVFGWPALLSSTGASLKSPSRLMRIVPSLIVLTAICLAAIHYGTVAHPFLLADNRHYTFYIWRRVIDRTWWSRYALAPFYAIMLRMWWTALGELAISLPFLFPN